MPHPLNFSLFRDQEFRLDMSSFNRPDEALLLPCPGSLLNICQRSGPYPPSDVAAEMLYTEAAFEELRQRLRTATEEKEKLEEWCVSKAQSAEKIAKVLLRKVHRLRVALQESEMERHPDSVSGPIYTINPPPPRVQPRRRPFVPTPSNRAEPACLDRSHQGIVAAFEQSVRHTTQAIRNEEARAREAAQLREELRAANKMLADERGLSRVLTLQAEGIQKVLNVQHNDIKNHKCEIADLRSLVKALQCENARLVACEEELERGEREAVQVLEARIGELEREVREWEGKNKALEAKVEEERKANTELGELVKDTEKRVNAEWHELCAEWCKELGEIREGLTAFETKLVAFLRRQLATRELEQRSQSEPEPELQSMTQIRVQDFAASSSPSIIDAEWDSPALEVRVEGAAATVDLAVRVKQLEQKNRDLEVELANVRHAGAELAGFYPLRRFHRRVSPRMEEEQEHELGPDESEIEVPDLVPATTTASSVSVSAAGSKRSWLLDVPDMDEEIPELRLPSPVTSLKREGVASGRAPEMVVSLRSGGDGGDQTMEEGGPGEKTDKGGEVEEGMWETTSASEMCSADSDPWSDGSVANLFM